MVVDSEGRCLSCGCKIWSCAGDVLCVKCLRDYENTHDECGEFVK